MAFPFSNIKGQIKVVISENTIKFYSAFFLTLSQVLYPFLSLIENTVIASVKNTAKVYWEK
jgi:hypothetical protein